MSFSEQILVNTAKDGSIDIAEWPRVLEDLLKRLHDIVYNDFPIPAIPLNTPHVITIDPEVAPTPPPTNHASRASTENRTTSGAATPAVADANNASSQNSTKENEGPREESGSSSGTTPTPLRTPFGYELTHNPAGTETAPPSDGGGGPEPDAETTLPLDHLAAPAGTLPPELLSLYQTTCRTLESEFSERPPHTVQRLAELVVAPRRHYRHLPAYLRALDRVVSVSSPTSDFPLQLANGLPGGLATAAGSFITNGDVHMAHGGAVTERDGLGSDESLGGALLTPIPWLRSMGNVLAPTTDEMHPLGDDSTTAMDLHAEPTTEAAAPSSSSESSDAAAGAPEAARREPGAITQGELLRQEQRAGIVPIAQHQTMLAHHSARPPTLHASAAAAHPTDAEETPHARGPEAIDMADTGPQSRPLGRTAGERPGLLGDIDRAVGRARSKSPQPESVGPVVGEASADGSAVAAGEAPASTSSSASVPEAPGVEDGDAMDGVEETGVTQPDGTDKDGIVAVGESAAGGSGGAPTP